MRRRRFMKLMAAGAFAAAVQPVKAIGAATKKPAAPDAARLTPEVRTEIESQKKALADTLKVIRSFRLEPGSPPAYVFRAERRRSGARAR